MPRLPGGSADESRARSGESGALRGPRLSRGAWPGQRVDTDGGNRREVRRRFPDATQYFRKLIRGVILHLRLHAMKWIAFEFKLIT